MIGATEFRHVNKTQKALDVYQTLKFLLLGVGSGHETIHILLHIGIAICRRTGIQACFLLMCTTKANQTTLLVSRPPVFIFLCGQAVIIYYSLFNIMAF